MIKIERKTIIITGASSGIGEQCAKLMAKEGHNVVLIGRNQEKLTAVVKELEQYNTTVISFQCDIANKEEVIKTFEQIKQKFAKVHTLVNNAGINSKCDITKVDPKPLIDDFMVNVVGAYMCICAALPSLQQGGSIINISSIRARVGTPSRGISYACAKAALINLTKSFALQLADKDIRVNAIAPGAVYPTGMSKSWSVEKQEMIKNNTPLKKMASPLDIAQTVEFLISNKAKMITGHTLDVNGGRWMN